MQAILGLTQSDLAALLGVSRAVLSLSAQPGRGLPAAASASKPR